MDSAGEKKVRRAVRDLGRQCLENMEVEARLCAYGLDLVCTGPTEFLPDHKAFISTTDSIPDALAGRPRLLKKLLRERRLGLSKAMMKAIEVDRAFAEPIGLNACFQLATAKAFGTSYVTNNRLDISFLGSITANAELNNRNAIAFRHLTSEVPFLGELTNKDILRIRDREEESFVEFRNALNRAITELRTATTMNRRDARCLYGDVIAPKLANLDRRVRIARRDLVTEAVHGVLGTIAALSFGLYSGFLTAEVAPIVTALGLPKIAADVEKVLAIGRAEDQVRNDDLYFLWRVKNLRRR